MTGKLVVYGADYSVYVRIVRLALHEKGVDYELVPIDAFARGGPGPDYLKRQPFGRVPAFEHDGFRLYETGAIARYVDEAFDGPKLQPTDAKARARMNQIVSIADAYVYRTLVWDVFVERVNRPLRGELPNESRIQAALDRAETCFSAITALKENSAFMVGEQVTLADLWLAAMFDYFLRTDEGRTLMAGYPALGLWWSHISVRQSVAATPYGE
jgi:glutathione S-transferase